MVAGTVNHLHVYAGDVACGWRKISRAHSFLEVHAYIPYCQNGLLVFHVGNECVWYFLQLIGHGGAKEQSQTFEFECHGLDFFKNWTNMHVRRIGGGTPMVMNCFERERETGRQTDRQSWELGWRFPRFWNGESWVSLKYYYILLCTGIWVKNTFQSDEFSDIERFVYTK